MRVSSPEAGPVLAMLAVAMLTMTMLPMRWDGAPAPVPAVVPTSNTSAVNMPLPSSPSPAVSHASWRKVGSMLSQLTGRLCDLALSKINSALLSVLLYLLKTAVLPKLPFTLLYSQKKDTKGLERKKDTTDVERKKDTKDVDWKKDTKDVRSVQQTQHAVQQQQQQQQRQQLHHRAPAGAVQSMQPDLLLFEQPDEQPEQPEKQHEGVQQQGIDIRIMNLEAMRIADLKSLVVEHKIGDPNKFMRLAKDGTKSDLVAFIRQSLHQNSDSK